MIRRFGLLLPLIAASGCFNFDAAYEQYCDAGRCTASSGGGAATGGGGGTGGGAATGGGGGEATGGGSATGGGGGTGGGSATGGGGGTTGCTQFMCPELDWQGSTWGHPGPIARGLMTESLTRFDVWAAYDQTPSGMSSSYQHLVYRFTDAGVTALDRTAKFDARVEAGQLRGLTMTDQWFAYRTYATHVEGNTYTDFTGCKQADGGVSDPWHYAVYPVSADEAWLVGGYMSICHWTRAGGLVETADSTLRPYTYLYDAYRAPSGTLYTAGVQRGVPTSNDSTAVVFREDGTPLGTPPYLASYYDDGFLGVDGTGNDVYVLLGTNSMSRGEVLKLQGDGGFASVYTAPYALYAFDVTPGGQVWAVGDSNGSLVVFDGGAWGEVALPLTESRGTVRWENISVTTDGIVLTGNERADAGRVAIVNTYRFGP